MCVNNANRIFLLFLTPSLSLQIISTSFLIIQRASSATTGASIRENPCRTSSWAACTIASHVPRYPLRYMSRVRMKEGERGPGGGGGVKSRQRQRQRQADKEICHVESSSSYRIYRYTERRCVEFYHGCRLRSAAKKHDVHLTTLLRYPSVAGWLARITTSTSRIPQPLSPSFPLPASPHRPSSSLSLLPSLPLSLSLSSLLPPLTVHVWLMDVPIHPCIYGRTDVWMHRTITITSGGRSAPKQGGRGGGRVVAGGFRSAGAAALRRRQLLGAELEEARRARPRARRDV